MRGRTQMVIGQVSSKVLTAGQVADRLRDMPTTDRTTLTNVEDIAYPIHRALASAARLLKAWSA